MELFSAIRDAFVTHFGDVGDPRNFFDGFGTCSYSGYHQHLRELHTERLLRSFSQGHLPPRSAGRTDCWIWEWQQCRSTLDIRQLLATPRKRCMRSQCHSRGRRWRFRRLPIRWPQPKRQLPTDVDPGRLPSDHLVTLWQFGTSDSQYRRGLPQQPQQPFRHVAPVAAAVFNCLQEYQFEVQFRGLQVAAGRTPKARSAVYAKLDVDLWSVKLSYSLEYGDIFTNHAAKPPVCMWHGCQCKMAYLVRVSYLLGC